MKKYVLFLLVAAAAGLDRALRRATRPERGHGVEPPGGAVDLGGSDRGQHGPVRVPQPGQAEHLHRRVQLDPR